MRTGLRGLFVGAILLVPACQKGGRLVDLRKGLEASLESGDTMAATDSLFVALNNPVFASAMVKEDVGASDLDSTAVRLVLAVAGSGVHSAELGDLPDAWNKSFVVLRIVERYYDLKPGVASRMSSPAISLVSSSASSSLARAKAQADAGDTAGAYGTLEQASRYLNTILPHHEIRNSLSALQSTKAGYGFSLGILSSGMSLEQAIFIKGPPQSEDSVYSVMAGDFGILVSWGNVSALVKQDTVREVMIVER